MSSNPPGPEPKEHLKRIHRRGAGLGRHHANHRKAAAELAAQHWANSALSQDGGPNPPGGRA